MSLFFCCQGLRRGEQQLVRVLHPPGEGSRTRPPARARLSARAGRRTWRVWQTLDEHLRAPARPPRARSRAAAAAGAHPCSRPQGPPPPPAGPPPLRGSGSSWFISTRVERHAREVRTVRIFIQKGPPGILFPTPPLGLGTGDLASKVCLAHDHGHKVADVVELELHSPQASICKSTQASHIPDHTILHMC